MPSGSMWLPWSLAPFLPNFPALRSDRLTELASDSQCWSPPTKHSNNWSKVNMAPKEICFWSSNHVSRTTTLSVSHKSFNSKIMWFFSAGSRAKILFGTHEECSNNHPSSCKDLANANAKHMKNNANTMKFAPTKRLRMIIHNLKICYPYAYSLELSANPPGKPLLKHLAFPPDGDKL